MTAGCWADPLSREERQLVARFLARACTRFWDAALPLPVRYRTRGQDEEASQFRALTQASIEMSGLHLDVTERAEVTTS